MAITIMLVIGSPGDLCKRKKHHHLTNTEKEAGVASDAQGNTCDFGPDHDQCRDQFLESQGLPQLGNSEHFGDCQPSERQGLDCEILNDN